MFMEAVQKGDWNSALASVLRTPSEVRAMLGMSEVTPMPSPAPAPSPAPEQFPPAESPPAETPPAETPPAETAEEGQLF
jgi:hypothetical protein